jgi:hypothetical protein
MDGTHAKEKSIYNSVVRLRCPVNKWTSMISIVIRIHHRSEYWDA